MISSTTDLDEDFGNDAFRRVYCTGPLAGFRYVLLYLRSGAQWNLWDQTLPRFLWRDDDFCLDLFAEEASRIEAEQRSGQLRLEGRSLVAE